MRRSAPALCVVVGLASLAACGGQTGEGDEGGNECIDSSPEPIDDTESSPLGFAPAEVLEFAQAQRFDLGRAGAGSSSLDASLTVRARANAARFIATRQLRDVGMPEACRGRIELDVDVELSVTQPSGDLQFSGDGRLSADSRYRAELTAQLDEAAFDALRTFELGPEEHLRNLELRALLTPAGSAGALTAEIEWLMRVGPQPEPKGDAPRARDFIAMRPAQVARWPNESDCEEGDVPLDRTESLFDVTPEEVLRRFTTPKTVRWSDGTTTKLTLEATAAATACLSDLDSTWFESLDWPAIAPENPAHFGLPIELSIATEDARYERRVSTVLQYRPRKTGGLERAWITHSERHTAGDAGGWSADVADLGTAWSTTLIVASPAIEGIESRLVLYGAPGPSACSSTTRMCTGTAGVSAPLLSGTIE